MKTEIDALFSKARKVDPIYHLLALGLAPVRRDLSEVNIIASLNLFAKKTFDSGSMDMVTALFLYQQHIEAKAFYTLLKNICNACLSIPYVPFPFRLSKHKNRLKQPSTSALIREVASSITNAGFPALADTFSQIHRVDFRNAFAHANYLLLEDKRTMLIGDYDDSSGSVELKEKAVAWDDFLTHFRTFFSFRFDVYTVIKDHKENSYNSDGKRCKWTRKDLPSNMDVTIYREKGAFRMTLHSSHPLVPS